METRYEENRPRSPFALNVASAVVYAVAALVVAYWFAALFMRVG